MVTVVVDSGLELAEEAGDDVEPERVETVEVATTLVLPLALLLELTGLDDVPLEDGVNAELDESVDSVEVATTLVLPDGEVEELGV